MRVLLTELVHRDELLSLILDLELDATRASMERSRHKRGTPEHAAAKAQEETYRNCAKRLEWIIEPMRVRGW